MLLIPGLEFHSLCQLEAEETFTLNAHDASLRQLGVGGTMVSQLHNLHI